jgi:branched-chain amino acid transport system ATP-binding protein
MSARLECGGLTGGRGATVVFRDLELDVEAGSVLALLGPNGAGKSTLLLTLAGLLPARAGTVAVDGATLRTGNPVAASRAGVVSSRTTGRSSRRLPSRRTSRLPGAGTAPRPASSSRSSRPSRSAGA